MEKRLSIRSAHASRKQSLKTGVTKGVLLKPARDVGAFVILGTAQWYVILPAIVFGLGLIVGLSALIYRCLRRPSGRTSAEGLLKTGLRPFWAGSSCSVKSSTSPSIRSTASLISISSAGRSLAPLIPRNPSTEIQIPERRSSFRSPTIPEIDPGQFRTECYADPQDKVPAGSPPERATLPQDAGTIPVSPETDPEDESGTGKLGTLQFSIDYDRQREALVVTVVKATELPVKDANSGSSDPYVKLHLLPEKRQKAKTRVVRRSLNPVFDEVFTFYGILKDQLNSITLHFVVLSFDRFSRDDLIGEVLYTLSSEGLGDKVIDVCREIAPRHVKIHSQGRGELLVSLCYQPSADRLTVVILKAKNLPKMDLTGLSDPYVKVYLLLDGQRVAKKKTHVKKRTLNPVFNESFQFDLPRGEDLARISLEFQVFDWDRMTKNEVIGRLEVGCLLSGSTEAGHWNEVMNCPRKQIAEWHRLKD